MRRILITYLALCALVVSAFGLTPGQRAVILSGQHLPSWLPLAAGAAPTLFADFTTEGGSNHYWYKGRQYAGFAAWNTAIGGTFSRASTATYLQGGVVKSASSGAARFPTDISLEPTGLRLTGAGTNLILQSQAFSNASWTKTNATATDNVATAPDGTSTAATMAETAANSIHQLTQSPSVLISTTYALSIFAKANGTRYISVSNVDGVLNGGYAVFDLQLGLVTQSASLGAGTLISASIVQYANGWWKCSVVANGMTTSTSNMIISASNSGTPAVDSAGRPSYAGNISNSYFAWGAQLTASAFPLDYIPTTTGTVTQAADAYSFSPFAFTTLSAFMKTINQQFDGSGGQRLLGVQDAGSSTLLHVNGASSFGNYNGVTGTLAYTFSGALSAAHKIMSGGSPSGRAIVGDGGTVVTDANQYIFAAPTSIVVGAEFGNASYSYGDISQLGLWANLAVSSAEMKRLTQ